MSSFDLVIRGGTVVLDSGPEKLDIGVAGGAIAAIAPELDGGREEVAATGLHVLPGAIDVHVHANEPGRTEWEGAVTASAGLAIGGTTTAFEMPLNALPPTVDADAWALKLAAWQGRAHVDFALWGGIVPGRTEALHELADAGAIGFKAFMVDSALPDFPAADDATLFAGMQVAAAHGLPVAVHAENSALIRAGTDSLRRGACRDAVSYLASRSPLAEIEAVARALLLAEHAGCAVHLVHLSSGSAVAMVEQARARGVDASCETCAHYLAFTVQDVERIGTAAKCAPPIRGSDEREALWLGIEDGTIAIVSTDHSPCPPAMKAGDFLDAWGGIAAGQLLLRVLLSEGAVDRGLPLTRVARVLSTVPAVRFGLPGKGRIEVGTDADLVLVELNARRRVTEAEIHHRHPSLCPYIGMALAGRPVRTLLRGRTIALGGELVGAPQGRLVRPERHVSQR